MELRHLRYFCAVAEWKGFSQAARKLHISQSAISEQISDLEKEIGVALLQRDKRHVELTTHGEVFLREAKKILKGAESAIELTRSSMRGEIGELSIAFFVWGTGSFFPKLVREFRRRHPNVRLSLNELTPAYQMEAFLTGKIDVGFTRPLEPPFDRTFNSELLYEDPIVAVLPKTHPLAKGPISVEALAGENFVLSDRSASPALFDVIISLCRKAGFSPRIANTSSVWSGVLTLVEAGEGIGLVPLGLRHMMSSRLVFCPLQASTASISLVLAWRPETENIIQQSFLDLVREFKPQIQHSIRDLCKDKSRDGFITYSKE
jgi:DNA-binding transcriptional LysR family regulator